MYTYINISPYIYLCIIYICIMYIYIYIYYISVIYYVLYLYLSIYLSIYLFIYYLSIYVFIYIAKIQNLCNLIVYIVLSVSILQSFIRRRTTLNSVKEWKFIT